MTVAPHANSPCASPNSSRCRPPSARHFSTPSATTATLIEPLVESALPVAPSPLIGREHELATLSDLLARPDTRLLTLTGADGSGKTRLALALAGLVGDILAAAPDIRLLITSRALLHLQAETIFDAPPLAIPPSLRGAEDWAWRWGEPTVERESGAHAESQSIQSRMMQYESVELFLKRPDRSPTKLALSLILRRNITTSGACAYISRRSG